MGAVVRAFDVRPVTKEQVEAMGGQFLEVPYQEDGSGAGGYAKEMSKEWHAAAREMLTKQCEDVDIVITTALIPGKIFHIVALLCVDYSAIFLKKNHIGLQVVLRRRWLRRKWWQR
jgi:hypothetical protein